MTVATIGSAARAALAVALVTAAAAAAQDAPVPPKTLDGMRFKSVDKLEGGATPEGVARAHWGVHFMRGEFHWQHTDVIEVGSYNWDPKTGAVTGKGLGGDRAYKGQYDAKTKTLIWEGKKYALIEPEKPKDKK